MSSHPPPPRLKGRGSARRLEGRFDPYTREALDDDWGPGAGEDAATSRVDTAADAAPEGIDATWVPAPDAAPATTVTIERARSILSRNVSPDVPFEASVNTYRGCEHGCAYCYARPSHAYLDLSPGLDFETRLYAKTNAVELLRAELARPGYVVSAINLGANTDPYQPIERDYRLTRGVLEVFAETRHPCTIVTKNALIERDLDLLQDLARDRLVHCFLSVTTLDNRLASRLEPRASAPHRRLRAVEALNRAGVPCGVLVAPIIPALTDADLEAILERAAAAGAPSAGYTVIRLPWELKTLFEEWLRTHVPGRAEHVLSLIRQLRGGRANDPRFGQRMRGTGEFAELLRQRFALACRRHGLARRSALDFDTTQFRPPRAPSPQGELF